MTCERKKSVRTASGAYIETYAYNPLFEGLQFKAPDGTPFNGDLSKVFDINDNVPGNADYDPKTAIHAIFRFKDGYLHADEKPAIEFPGHVEFWTNGVLKTVCAGYDSIQEDWHHGMLVSVDYKKPEPFEK